MKQEYKELLLKDLSARLPYGVKVTTTNPAVEVGVISGISIERKISVRTKNADIVFGCTEIKPYLRKMSSMTEEERLELSRLSDDKFRFYLYTTKCEIICYEKYNYLEGLKVLDWLNKKMFAYRTYNDKDMFELGLALEAPEGMYK